MNEQASADTSSTFRIEHDSLGNVHVPRKALYGAQTQRAINNFPISGLRFPGEAIEAIALIKSAAVQVNLDADNLDPQRAGYIQRAADVVASGEQDDAFPVDIFMTGSGTSFNMNANEVIANLAMRYAEEEGVDLHIHPNDHVNKGQSSNDVIPSTIHIALLFLLTRELLPALDGLRQGFAELAEMNKGIAKTGRTHLMDALPIWVSDEFNGWAHQVGTIHSHIEESLPHLGKIAMGGTAVGNGLNALPGFGAAIAANLAERTGLPIAETPNHFASQSSMDEIVRMSGLFKTYASLLIKIANDLRLMNSGPNAGLHEISLEPIQPGSSIMPGKTNPVMCEVAMQVGAQVIANDVAVTIGNERGNFQLNTMLPLIGHNVWQSARLLANATRELNNSTIKSLKVNKDVLRAHLEKNPIIVTSLAPEIGYDKAAEISKRAFREGRSVVDIAIEVTGMDEDEIRAKLNPDTLARGNKKADIS